MMDKGREAALHALIADVLAFYRQDVNEFTLSVWRQACDGFEPEQVRKALTAHAMDPDRGQFAPKPADMVRALQGTQADRSLIAWGQVLDAIRRVGAYQSVEFPDKAIHAAIADMGGWPAVCRTETEDLPFVQKRFCEAHRTYSQRGHSAAPRLSGDHEQDNALRGHATPVVQIGTPGAPHVRKMERDPMTEKGLTTVKKDAVLGTRGEMARSRP